VIAQTKPRNQALRAAAKMPLLSHVKRGERFDISKSEVVQWLMAQPEVQQETFNWIKRQGAIVFEDGQWRGAEWHE
jgi:hypothetical protein